MNDSTYLTRYLLGELSEDERTALEEQYIADPNIFGEVARAESDLVDDYVRGKLAPEAHERFERVYLARPQRRERVKFAEALLTRLDRAETPVAVGASSADAWFDWRAALDRTWKKIDGAASSLQNGPPPVRTSSCRSSRSLDLSSNCRSRFGGSAPRP